MARKRRGIQRRAAWLQFIALVVALGLAATLLMRAEHRPFDGETLSILTGQLRSNAREARELVRLNPSQSTYSTFTQQHARQLGENTARIQKALHDTPAVATLETQRQDAEHVASDLVQILAAIAANPDSPSAMGDIDRLAERADAVHARQRSGG